MTAHETNGALADDAMTREIKFVERGIKRAQQRVDARRRALLELKQKWAVATATKQGVIIGQKRFARPRNEEVVVEDIYYNDYDYPEFDLHRVSICFDYSSVDPVPLAVVLRDSDPIAHDSAQAANGRAESEGAG